MATINGTFNSLIAGSISGQVGTPGPAGPQGLPGPAGAPGPGLPAGGLEGQIVVKASTTDYDTVWVDNAAETLTATVRNETGATLTKGTVVYINGASGNKATVTKASAASEAASSKTFAILSADILDNQNGQAVTVGLLKGLNTLAFSPGANLWLSTTAGEITQTPPVSPNHAVFLGNATRIHATQGEIEVRIQNGLELGELHDVLLTSPTEGQVLKYDATSGLWKNGTDVGGVAWGGITGDLSNQGDLVTALGLKYDASNPLGYITSSALTGYATESWVTAGFYPLTGNPSSFLVAADITGKANLSGATFTGLVGTVASTTTTAGLNVPHGTAPSAPVNGDVWSTTSGLFARINGVNRQYVDFDGSQTINGNKTFSNATSTFGSSTATGTIGLASGATISGSTKTLNIGTGGVSGSTTLTTIGPVLGASTTSIGNTTAASTLNLATGATLTATTKAVNIGTNGVAGSTTNIAIGSTTGTSTTTLQGTTNGVTAAADTNSVALATTAYVVGQAGSATPLVNGTAAVGTSLRYARQDHVHPTDTSRAPLASPALTGTPTAPTATPGTNTTQIATTAFVQQEVPAASTTAAGKVELATRVEVIEPTSNTLAVTPFQAIDVLMHPGYMQIAQNNNNVTTATSGAGAGIFTTSMTRVCLGPNASTAGYVTYRPQTNGGVAQMWSRGNSGAQINFSKKVWISGRSSFDDTFIGDANNTARVTIGKAAVTAGALAQKGIGWQKAGGSTATFSLLAHNGTTLTTVATSTSLSTLGISGGSTFDWSIYSDGSGNVTMFINDTQVATTSAGPTGLSLASCVWQEEIDQSASAATRMYFSVYGGHFYHV